MRNDRSSSLEHNDHKFHTQDSIEWIICFVTMLNLHRAHLHFTSKFFYPRLYSGHFRLQQEKRLGKKIRNCSFPCALVSVPCWTVCEKLLPDDKTIGKTKTTARVYFGVFRFPFCSVDEFSVFPFFFSAVEQFSVFILLFSPNSDVGSTADKIDCSCFLLLSFFHFAHFRAYIFLNLLFSPLSSSIYII